LSHDIEKGVAFLTADGALRILALDPGEARVGVAISDPLGLSAQPLPTLKRRPSGKFYEQLGRLLEDWSVSEVVVGLPVGPKGEQSGKGCESVLRVLEECRKLWPQVTWRTQDERFTTQEAIELLKMAPKKKRETKGLRDQLAAQMILEGYLARRRKDLHGDRGLNEK
jgi:putative Holliday junction resolvase